jgi:hypothetical protein
VQFIATADGAYINLAHVTAVVPRHAYAGDRTSVAYTKDGPKVINGFTDEVYRVSLPCIPASPGFFLLAAYDEGENPIAIESTAVVAWRVWPTDSTEPVIVEMSMRDDADQICKAVLCPDGQVVDVDGRWPNQQAWQDCLPEMLKEHRDTLNLSLVA